MTPAERSKVRRFFELIVRGRRPEEEVRDELDFHLSMKVDALMVGGLSRADAEREARRQFGPVDRWSAAATTETRGYERDRRWRDRWSALWSDLAVAGRRLRRAPAFLAVSLALVALGVGGGITVYGVARGVVLHPLPFPEPGRLFGLYEATADGQGFRLPDYPTFRDWRAQADVFERIAYVRGTGARWISPDGTERIVAAYVSDDFFPLLGRPALLGRTLTAADAGASVAVVSYRFWRERLGGSPGVLGSVLNLSAGPVTVVGVTPPGVGYPEWATIWMPIESIGGAARVALGQRGVHADGRMIGRLKRGISVEAAQAAVGALTARLAAAYPADQGTFPKATMLPLTREVLLSTSASLGDPTQPLLLIGAGLALVLGIACTNLANLSLTRTVARRQELAVRAALGGGRWRLIRLVATETLVVTGIGGLLGLGLAAAAIRTIRLHSAELLPRAEEIVFSPAVAAGGFALVVAVTLIVALIPAWLSTRLDPEQALRAGSRAGGHRDHQRLRAGLAMIQIVIAVVMMVETGLVVRSLRRVLDVPLGFEPNGLASIWIAGFGKDGGDGDSSDRSQQLISVFRELNEAVAAVPGVSAATLVNFVPLGGSSNTTKVFLEGEVPDPKNEQLAMPMVVAPNYFATMQIAIVGGRAFEAGDLTPGAARFILNESFARRLWPKQNPLGRRLSISRAVMGRADFGEMLQGEVIGIAKDVRQFGPETPYPDQVYVLYTANPWAHMRLVVRADRGLAGLLPALNQTVRRLHPEMPIRGFGQVGFEPLTDTLAATQTSRRLVAWLTTGFGIATVSLVVLGLYAVLSYLVTQRSREIGVRSALGASRRDIIRSIVWEGMRLAIAGVVGGVILAAFAVRFARGLLYGIEPTDATSFVVAAASLLGVSLLATLIPAWRAARVDPVTVLRAD
ncbi:MAG: ABC transporter permease [Gemmatimonadota bacterium]